MNQCPKCGKVSGLHSSILPGCMCEWSMQAMKEGKDFTISKPWVGLTDEDCVEAIDENFDFALDHGNVSNASVIRYARAIEAKLKEKNNG